MTFQKEVRYTSQSISPPPRRHRKSKSPDRDRRRSRSQDPVDSGNPGNNIYVTGLSTRVTTEDLEKYFNKEGKVTACEVVLDPCTKESRGFAFVTMETLYDADRCIKYLNCSVLEGRLITVEKAKRRCGRTPTPGRYQGSREKRVTDDDACEEVSFVNGSGRNCQVESPPQRFGLNSYSCRRIYLRDMTSSTNFTQVFLLRSLMNWISSSKIHLFFSILVLKKR